MRIGARRTPLVVDAVRFEDCEGQLALERDRWPVDRIKASFDRELGEILADGQDVGDQVVDRVVECVKDPLRGQIQGHPGGKSTALGRPDPQFAGSSPTAGATRLLIPTS
jgi:hypothetical protein